MKYTYMYDSTPVKISLNCFPAFSSTHFSRSPLCSLLPCKSTPIYIFYIRNTLTLMFYTITLCAHRRLSKPKKVCQGVGHRATVEISGQCDSENQLKMDNALKFMYVGCVLDILCGRLVCASAKERAQTQFNRGEQQSASIMFFMQRITIIIIIQLMIFRFARLLPRNVDRDFSKPG